jgi:hypothetical protein
MAQESGWQVSGDAPSFYMRFAYAMQEPWTEDLMLQARCKVQSVPGLYSPCDPINVGIATALK